MKQIKDAARIASLHGQFNGFAKLAVPLKTLTRRLKIKLASDTMPSMFSPLIFEADNKSIFAMHVSAGNKAHTIVQSLKSEEKKEVPAFEILKELNVKDGEVMIVTSHPDNNPGLKLF